MLKTIIKLPDGTQISSGKIMDAAIQSCTITECVNSGEELTLGSTCAASLEATVLITGGDLNIAAGDEVSVYKQDGNKEPVQVGVFILERPTRATANTMNITGYDRVSKLDKDLTVWLKNLTGWPYQLTAFASAVCAACGLTFKTTNVPNGDFMVQSFTRSAVTGRQIMQWLGEISARFCRATADGEIELAWYTDSEKEISASGDLYYFQNGLSYENYEVAKVDAVQLRLADSDNSALWPAAEGGANSYIIASNPILSARVTEALLPVLDNIRQVLTDVSYRPCQVSIPANLDIRVGSTVKITDKNGTAITAYVMTKTQSGQKDTLEATGSRRRDTSASANNKTAAERAAETEGYANNAAKNAAQTALDGQTQEQIYLKLTDDEKLKGLFMENGELYINASYLKSGEIDADLIKTGTINADLIKSGSLNADLIKSGTINADLIEAGSIDANKVSIKNLVVNSAQINSVDAGKITSGYIDSSRINGGTLNVTKGATIAGWKLDENSIFKNSGSWHEGTFMCTGSTGKYSIGGSGERSGWVFGAGGKFGVTSTGAVWCSDFHATAGSVGGWTIGSDLTATTTADWGGGVKLVQTVVLSVKGIKVTSALLRNNSAIQPVFPDGVDEGKDYEKYVSWTELLKVFPS